MAKQSIWARAETHALCLYLSDIDIISKMKNAEVGFTVTFLSIKKIFEPYVETTENDLFK
jgi:hypothetical protein